MKTAITGGIGSGKSYVCQLLKERGIDIYDCDSAAKRLMRTSEQLKARLRALVGDDVYIDGRLNKPLLAQFLLASDNNKQAVNAIVHPAVADDFIASGMEWMECAILYESGFDRLVDRTQAHHEARRHNTRESRGMDKLPDAARRGGTAQRHHHLQRRLSPTAAAVFSAGT